jgi:hypothetical protein
MSAESTRNIIFTPFIRPRSSWRASRTKDGDFNASSIVDQQRKRIWGTGLYHSSDYKASELDCKRASPVYHTVQSQSSDLQLQEVEKHSQGDHIIPGFEINNYIHGLYFVRHGKRKIYSLHLVWAETRALVYSASDVMLHIHAKTEKVIRKIHYQL